jgi:hypothetical protein
MEGYDCEGEPVSLSATESCTETAATCTEEYAIAKICAGIKADRNLAGAAAVMTDCL